MQEQKLLAQFGNYDGCGVQQIRTITFKQALCKLSGVAKAMQPLTIPMMVDGDTGYGNPMNVMRTVAGFARAGGAAVMIED